MRLLMIALCCLSLSSAAKAQDMGVQFSQMPVGTRLHYEDFKGGVWIDLFVGRQGDQYLMQRHYPSGMTHERLYSLDGHLQERRYGNGKIHSYAPHSCQHVLGHCQYNYAGVEKYAGRHFSHLTAKGEAEYMLMEAGVNSGRTFTTNIRFGPYNVMQEMTWQDETGLTRWIRLVGVEGVPMG